MKKLLALIIVVFVGASAFAQADSLARPMNGFYKWNGEQFYTDSLWIDTNIVSPTAGTILSVDTADWGSTGYVKLTNTTAITGDGAATRVPFFDGTTNLTSASTLVYDAPNLTLELRRIANTTGAAGMGIFYDSFKRITVDSNLTLFNENTANAKDVFFYSPTDTVLALDVDNDRVGINATEAEMSNAAFTIAPNNSDTAFKFVEVPISAGANTPTFNNCPYSGSVRWIQVKLVISGVESNAVIPVVSE